MRPCVEELNKKVFCRSLTNIFTHSPYITYKLIFIIGLFPLINLLIQKKTNFFLLFSWSNFEPVCAWCNFLCFRELIEFGVWRKLEKKCVFFNKKKRRESRKRKENNRRKEKKINICFQIRYHFNYYWKQEKLEVTSTYSSSNFGGLFG